MSLDPRYVTSVDLSPYLCDKDTGAPLAGGIIQFWQDDSRSTPKTVYELTGSPPNYTYAALPNPVILSATGTIEDANGNSCALYYFPYDSFVDDANIQLYYIVVMNSLGVIQFTREGWPNITAETSPVVGQNNTIVNLLSNPQFADVLFDPDIGLTINYTGSANVLTNIAPDWDLLITHVGAGTATVTRTALAGSSNWPTNAPYYLTFTAGANTTSFQLKQRLYHNPGIWSPQAGGQDGYICANVVLANTSTAQISYVPSTGTAQTILTVTNLSGGPEEFSGTIQLDPSNNPSTADTGYVDIIVYLANTGNTVLTSVQVVALESNDENIVFEQTPVNRQRDQLFHYYNPLLQAKPINSYLIGWDFPYNPAQFLGTNVSAQALGVNTSYYAWDQTIIFQSATNGVTISQSANGAFTAVCNAATTQIALIQYLDQSTARDLLANRLSVNIDANSSRAGGIGGKITLWYTTGATLPSMSANASLVASLDATGKPNSFNLAGGSVWTEVVRSGLGDAVFNINTAMNSSQFSGWQDMGVGSTTATFFAIVIGTVPLTNVAPDTLNFLSISLVPGDIATQPAPKTPDEVLRECERFYEQSYSSGTLPGTITLNNVCIAPQTVVQYPDQSGNYFVIGAIAPFEINYQQPKRSSTPVVSFYSPNTGTIGNVYYKLAYDVIVRVQQDMLLTNWTNLNTNNSRSSYVPVNPAVLYNSLIAQGHVATSYIQLHYTVDARLGIV